jgi:hypothetical protein
VLDTASALPEEIATNLLSPAARHFQFPSVKILRLVHVSPSDEYLPKCPADGVIINFPLAAIAVVSVTSKVKMLLVLSSDICYT